VLTESELLGDTLAQAVAVRVAEMDLVPVGLTVRVWLTELQPEAVALTVLLAESVEETESLPEVLLVCREEGLIEMEVEPEKQAEELGDRELLPEPVVHRE